MAKGLIWATAEDMARNRGRVLTMYRQLLRSLNSPELPLTWAARLAKKAEVRAIFIVASEERSLHNIADLIDVGEYSLSLLRKAEIPKHIQWVKHLVRNLQKKTSLWLCMPLLSLIIHMFIWYNNFVCVKNLWSFTRVFRVGVIEIHVLFNMHVNVLSSTFKQEGEVNFNHDSRGCTIPVLSTLGCSKTNSNAWAKALLMAQSGGILSSRMC